MKGTNHGIPFRQCNLCGDDLTRRDLYGDYCMRCTESCLHDASELLDKLAITYDTELAYECMTKVLEGRA